MPETVVPSDLQPGDTLRYKRAASGLGPWRHLTYHGTNRDGSMAVFDEQGSSRALLPGRFRFEVKRTGTRGKPSWVPLTTGET